MIIIALLGIIFATTFDLDNISMAGSISFLIVFSLVNLANFKLVAETQSSRFHTISILNSLRMKRHRSECILAN